MESKVFDLDEVGVTFLVLLEDRAASYAVPAHAFVLVDAHFVYVLVWLLLVCDLVEVYLTWRFH